MTCALKALRQELEHRGTLALKIQLSISTTAVQRRGSIKQRQTNTPSSVAYNECFILSSCGRALEKSLWLHILVTLVVLGIANFVAVLVEVAVRDVQELVWLELLVVVRDVVLVVVAVLRKHSWRWHKLRKKRLEVHLWPCSTPSLYYAGMQKNDVYMCRRTNCVHVCVCVCELLCSFPLMVFLEVFRKPALINKSALQVSNTFPKSGSVEQLLDFCGRRGIGLNWFGHTKCPIQLSTSPSRAPGCSGSAFWQP